MRRNMVIIGVILFFVGLAMTIIASNVLKDFEELVKNIIGTIGFFIWFFSIPTIIVGYIMTEK